MARRVRTAGLLTVCLLAAAAAVWFAADGSSRWSGDLLGTDPEATGTARSEAPGLAATGTRHLVTAQRAEGGLGGTVRRDGVPVPAEVAVYRLADVPWGASAEGSDPGNWHNSARPAAMGEPVAVVRADGDGRFEIRDLPGGHYRVVAAGKERRGACRHVFLPGVGRRVDIDIHLAPGGAGLRGTVRFEDGRPWRGRVLATPTWDRRWFEGPLPGDPPGVPTDDEGRFELRALPYGPLRVQAIDALGVRILSPRVWVPYETSLEIVVRNPDTWVDVRVVASPGGQPIPSALVLATGYSRYPAPDAFLAVTTDAEGHARVPTGNDDLWLHVEAPGWANADVQLPAGPPQTVISLARVATVSGRVVDARDKAPVAGLSVSIGTSCFAITDAAGHFELHAAPAGPRVLDCRGDGWRPLALAGRIDGGWPVTVLAGSTATVELEAWRGVVVRGRVVGPDDAPVAGAAVTAHRRKGENAQEAVEGSATTDAVGAFEIAGLAPGVEHTFLAKAPGYALASSESWGGSAEAPPEGPVLRLRPPRRIDVHVTDERGSALPGVRVALRGGEALWTYVMTGDDGWARVGGLSRERLHVWARCGGRAVHDQTVEPAPDDTTVSESIEITLGEGDDIAGRVLWRDGTPAVAIEVTLGPRGKTDRSDADGAFRFDFVPAGTCTLKAAFGSGEEAIATERTVTPGMRAVELRLDAPPPIPAPKVTLTVLDGAGLPVAWARILRRTKGGTDKEQSVTSGLAEVAAGWERLVVQGALASTGAPLPVGPLELGPHDGTSTRLTVTLPPEAAVEGFVVAEAGAPLGGVRLTAGPSASHSDALGRFRLGGLGHGEVRVEVDPPVSHLRQTATFTAGTQAAEIRVRRAAEVVLSVVDPRGVPVAGAPVAWERTDAAAGADPDASGDAKTDARGEVRPARLDPAGRYTLRARPASDDQELLLTTVHDWAPVDTTLALAEGLRVEGVVMDARGAPVEGARINAAQGDTHVSATTDAQGRFVLRRLDPGSVRVVAWLGDDDFDPWIQESQVVRELEGEPIDVAAGTSGLRLTLDVAPPLRFVLSGVSADDVALEEAGATAYLRPEAGEEDASGWCSELSADFRGRFDNPAPGARYTLWIPGLPGGRYVLEPGLVSRDAPYRITARRGGSVRGVIHADPGVTIGGVYAHCRGAYLAGTLGEHGTFEIRGLPPGPIEIEVDGRFEAEGVEIDIQASATAQVGGSVTLNLRRDGN